MQILVKNLAFYEYVINHNKIKAQERITPIIPQPHKECLEYGKIVKEFLKRKM